VLPLGFSNFFVSKAPLLFLHSFAGYWGQAVSYYHPHWQPPDAAYLKLGLVIYAYNHHVRLLSPERLRSQETTVYSGEEADIVMQSSADQRFHMSECEKWESRRFLSNAWRA